MLVLKYLGYGLSILLTINGIIFWIIGMYAGIKYTNMLQPTKKSIKLNLRYWLLGILSLGLGFWLFLTIEVGFSWNLLVLIAGGMLAMSSIVLLYGFMRHYFLPKNNDV